MSLHRAENQPFAEVELMPNLYYYQYGEKAGFQPGQFWLMWYDARARYGDTPYHAFGHAVSTFCRTMEMTDFYEAQGIALDRKVLMAASLFHDADYEDETFRENGYISKEAHSADIFAYYAQDYGFTKDQTAHTIHAILATALNETADSAEGAVMIAADIGNISEDYRKQFAASTNNLALEHKIRAEASGQEFDSKVFEDTCLKVLCEHLFKIISNPYIDLSPFTQKAVTNLERLAKEISRRRHTRPDIYLRSLGSEVVSRVLPHFNSDQGI